MNAGPWMDYVSELMNEVDPPRGNFRSGSDRKQFDLAERRLWNRARQRSRGGSVPLEPSQLIEVYVSSRQDRRDARARGKFHQAGQ